MGAYQFLLDRIGEDEAAAEYAASRAGGPDWSGWWLGDFNHYQRHNPDLVLAECQAKRTVVSIHRTDDPESPSESICVTCLCAPDCETLRALASAYADHPDYDPAWRL